MRKEWVILGVLLAFVPAVALELSGSFFTGFSLAGTSFTGWNTLSLRFSSPSLSIETTSTWQGLALAEQTLTLSWALGSLGLEVGLVFKPVSALNWTSWGSQELVTVASFVSLKLNLGSLHLLVTLQAQ